jgi:hypothetical protein
VCASQTRRGAGGLHCQSEGNTAQKIRARP